VAEAIHAALLKVQLFAGSAPQELEYIARRAVSRHFDAAEMIFSEGDPCDGLFVIRSGSVRLFKTSAGGREQTLAIEGAGNSIAELPVFDGGAYPASAAATTDSELIFIARKDFQSLCLEYPQFALRVVRQVGARLRRLVGTCCALPRRKAARRRAGSRSRWPAASRTWRHRWERCASWFRET
jgi:CRP/FNR family transcriptional regulator